MKLRFVFVILILSMSVFACSGGKTDADSTRKNVEDTLVAAVVAENLVAEVEAPSQAPEKDLEKSQAVEVAARSVVRSPFTLVAAIESPRVQVASAMAYRKDVFALNAEGGTSFSLDLHNKENPVIAELSDHGQVACVHPETEEHPASLAMIERDRKQGTTELLVLTLEKDKDLEHASRWHAKTRGFMPNPGASCAFVNPRELIVEGTRLRDKRLPFHGIFTITPLQLDHWASVAEHVPTITGARVDGTQTHVVARHIIREEGSVYRQDIEYAVSLCEKGKEGSVCNPLTELKRADHLNNWSEFVYEVSDEGGCIRSEALAEAPDCLFADDKIKEFRWLNVGWEANLASGRHVLVVLEERKFRVVDLPAQEHVVAALGGGYFLVVDQVGVHANLGEHLRVVRL